MALFQESGQTPERRKEEAQKLLARLDGNVRDYNLTERELKFIESVSDQDNISPKQLFWLRDICDKYDL